MITKYITLDKQNGKDTKLVEKVYGYSRKELNIRYEVDRKDDIAIVTMHDSNRDFNTDPDAIKYEQKAPDSFLMLRDFIKEI